MLSFRQDYIAHATGSGRLQSSARRRVLTAASWLNRVPSSSAAARRRWPSIFTDVAILAGLLMLMMFIHNQFQENRVMAAEPSAKDTQLGHMVFFTLNESTQENKDKLVELCKKHLTKHPGEVYFSVGTIVPDLARDVNDRNFDVALHVVFENRAAHDAYQTSPRHLEFIAAIKGTIKQVRVFDSNLAP
jgi:quinol monooxygenase YgiN